MHPILKRAYGQTAAYGLARLESRLQSWPLERSLRFGAAFGRATHRLAKRRRIRAESNLAMAFPTWAHREVEATAKRCFEHFGTVAADFVAGSKRTAEEVDALSKIVGQDILDEASALGRGVIVVAAHLGHWERAAQWLSVHGYPVSVVVRDADDDGLNARVNAMRSASGTEVVSRGNSTVTVLRRLREGKIVAILADQNAEDAYVPFFGRMAGVNCGVGVLAARTGAPVVTGVAWYEGAGRVTIVCGRPLEAKPDGDVRGTGMMRAYHEWLERSVTERPEQWLWFHDRWRYAREAGLR